MNRAGPLPPNRRGKHREGEAGTREARKRHRLVVILTQACSARRKNLEREEARTPDRSPPRASDGIEGRDSRRRSIWRGGDRSGVRWHCAFEVLQLRASRSLQNDKSGALNAPFRMTSGVTARSLQTNPGRVASTRCFILRSMRAELQQQQNIVCDLACARADQRPSE